MSELDDIRSQIVELRSKLGSMSLSLNNPSGSMQTPLSSGLSLNNLITGNRQIFGGLQFLGNFAADSTVFEVQAIAQQAQAYIVAMGMNSETQGHAVYMASTPNLAISGRYNGAAWNSIVSTYFGSSAIPSLPLVLVVNDLVAPASAFVAFAAENIGGVKKVGIGGVPSTGIPAVSGNGGVVFFGDTIRLFTAQNTPANSAAAGNLGEMRVDDNYIYVYTTAGWKRTAIAAF